MDALSFLTPEAHAALRRVPARLQEDAISEALLAHVGGRDQAQAIDAFRKREARHAAAVVTFTDLGPRNHPAIEDLTTDRAAVSHHDDDKPKRPDGRRAGTPFRKTA